MNADAVREAYADGATLVLQSLHRIHPPLVRFCRALAYELGHPTQCNAYVTPAQNHLYFAALDLTRAEQSLVILLLEGRTLRDAAAARAISFNTARRQLASVFDKTGVHRQSELLRLLIG